MFYAHFVLSKKGPLARIWLAAHWDKKLTKAHVFETNIEGSVEAIIQPKMKLALRTSGHLLLGVVRIYSRKAKYLLADCNEAFVKIKMAFRPGAVDLPEENREAAMAAITLPEDFHEFDTAMADLSDIDVHTQFAVNQSRPEEITMREDLGNITLVGDDGFGDMGFDGSTGMMQDGHLDDSLYKSADSVSCFLLDGSESAAAANGEHEAMNDVSFDGRPISSDVGQSAEDIYASDNDDYEGPAGADDDDDDVSDGGNFGADVDHELFGDAGGGLFEEPPAMTPAAIVDTASSGGLMATGSSTTVSQTKNNNDMFMSPSRTPRYALADVTQQQNVADQLLTSGPGSVDHTTLLPDETEAFALEPIDVTAIGTERKVRKKRRLVIDEMKSIASETMKLQLSDTSEIVSTLDLAPPTKKLMHWKETGGVEKLFAFPGKQIVSRKLSRLFSTNLVRRSSQGEQHVETTADIERSLIDIEQGRRVVTENSRLDVAAQSDVSDMPELAPATQDAYIMPASVAPCITNDNNDSLLHISYTTNNTTQISMTPRPTCRSSPASGQHPTTPLHLPHMSPPPLPPGPTGTPSSQLIPTLAPYGGSDDENDDIDDDYELNDTAAADDDDDDDGVASHVSSEPQDETTLEPVDEESEMVAEGQEADAEERRWNKRSQQMLMALNRCLHRHDTVTFRQMAPPSASHSRKQAAAKFYTFLVLKKMEAIEVCQKSPYGDIVISRGSKFDLLS